MAQHITTFDKNIIFRFAEDITNGRFNNSTKSGIMIHSADVNQSSQDRWGVVTHVGDKVDEVKVGEYVLIQQGKWTNGFYVDGVRYWKTDVTQIIASADESLTTY